MGLQLPGLKSIFPSGDGEIKVKKGFSSTNIIPVFPLWVNRFSKTYTLGSTLDTAITPDFITYLTPTGVGFTTFKILGTRIEVMIYNRSGVSDNYDFELTNETKSTTLRSVTNATIVNKGFITWQSYYGIDQITPGDVIKFNVSAGVVGTAAGELSNGQIGFHVAYMIENISLSEWLGAHEL